VVLLLVGLLIGLSVLKDIFVEGAQRHRSRGSSEPPEGTGDSGETGGDSRESAGAANESGRSITDTGRAASRSGSGGATTADIVVCDACETKNDAGYTFCQECLQRL